MASRILHLAVAERLLTRTDIPQPERFRLGSVLPDAYEGGREARWKTHLLIHTPEGGRTNDLTAFRARFGERLKTDGLYLGYYFHLLEDMVFRRVVYQENGWRPDTPEKVERLHGDYRRCNAWAIRRYGVRDTLRLPDDFRSEALYEWFPFCPEALLEALHDDFAPCEENGTYFFFHEEMAADFVRRAEALCLRELEALRSGAPPVNEYDWVWGA